MVSFRSGLAPLSILQNFGFLEDGAGEVVTTQAAMPTRPLLFDPLSAYLGPCPVDAV